MWDKCMDPNCDLFFTSHIKMVNHFRIEHLGLPRLDRPHKLEKSPL